MYPFYSHFYNLFPLKVENNMKCFSFEGLSNWYNERNKWLNGYENRNINTKAINIDRNIILNNLFEYENIKFRVAIPLQQLIDILNEKWEIEDVEEL